MSGFEQELKKIAALAYLDSLTEAKLAEDIAAIMGFVEQLREVDTTQVSPLFHPLALKQCLREDEVNHQSQIAALQSIAPQFQDNLFLVPKVIDSGK